MCIICGCLQLGWGILILIRRKNLLSLQVWGWIILTLNGIEISFMYLSLSHSNEGNEYHAMSLWSLLQVIAGALKQTTARTVLLLLMLGTER